MKPLKSIKVKFYFTRLLKSKILEIYYRLSAFSNSNYLIYQSNEFSYQRDDRLRLDEAVPAEPQPSPALVLGLRRSLLHPHPGSLRRKPPHPRISFQVRCHCFISFFYLHLPVGRDL